jgi:hypothetical protein
MNTAIHNTIMVRFKLILMRCLYILLDKKDHCVKVFSAQDKRLLELIMKGLIFHCHCLLCHDKSYIHRVKEMSHMEIYTQLLMSKEMCE